MKLKNFSQFVNESIVQLNELDLSTYSKLMDKTESYPWIKFVGDKLNRAKKYQNINTLAKELFTKEFEKKYRSQSIKNADHSYTFDQVRFNTNYTNYSLVFKSTSSDNPYTTLVIKSAGKNGYRIDKSDFKDEFDEKSKTKLKEMLKYNLDQKTISNKK
jgi:hypothetical protein